MTATLEQQFANLFNAYKQSIGNFHDAPLGAESARLAGVIEESYVALRLFCVNAGMPGDMRPPKPTRRIQHGSWDGYDDWFDTVQDFGTDAGVWLAVNKPAPGVKSACRGKGKRGPYNKAVTERQTQVYETWARHNCAATQAAAELGISPQSVRRTVATVNKKLPGVVRRKLQPKTHRLKHNRRGQADLTQPD
jgi:hypothetical protein